MNQIASRITRFAVVLIAGAAAPIVAQAPTKAVARASRQSWTNDRVELIVGDIVTVRVDENLLASAENKTVAGDDRSRDLGLDISQNLAAAGLSPSVAIHSGNTGSSSLTGQASRSNRFVGDITAQVIGIGPTGLLQVKGSKSLKLDKITEELTLSGWIRPEDVSSKNVVESARVADAAVEYHSSGGLEKPKGHLLLRILGWFWP